MVAASSSRSCFSPPCEPAPPVTSHCSTGHFLICGLLLATSFRLVLEITFSSNLQRNTGGKLKVTGSKIGSATWRDLRCCTVREGCSEVTESRNIWGMERSAGEPNIKNMKRSRLPTFKMQVQGPCYKGTRGNTKGECEMFFWLSWLFMPREISLRASIFNCLCFISLLLDL